MALPHPLDHSLGPTRSALSFRNLREEVKKGLYGRLKQGFYPWRAPIGYLDQGTAKPKVPDPIQGLLVTSAFELYGSGTHSLPQLTREMFRRGLRNRNGGKVSQARSSQPHASEAITLAEQLSNENQTAKVLDQEERHRASDAKKCRACQKAAATVSKPTDTAEPSEAAPS